MYRKVFNMLSLLLVMAVAFSAVSPAAAQPGFDSSEENQVEESSNGIYIIQMIHAPAISYEGDIPGLATTKPNNGEKLDQNDPDVQEYVGHLEEEHDDALRESGGEKVYDYGYTFNGFAAQLTVQQANKLVKVDGVLQVSPDTLQTMDTSSTPSFLGLDARRGLWNQLGGSDEAGKGVVIGIIDSGIWPESLSFADHINEDTNQWTFDSGDNIELDYKAPRNWSALCQFTDASCNNKLIGAQYYNAAWGGDAAIAAQRPWEFLSPRDYNAHGTHTASTAGGNFGVQATGPAAVFGTISGMAPHAYISVYKALWSTQSGDTASGFTSDLVAAIDQAVADGVDVINYSISGSTTNFLDPVEIAFLNAADAGVFVAASAGNSGPASGTVAHPSPWITTVAAGTHNRNGAGSVTLGGVTYSGASLAVAAVTAPLIDSTAAGLPGANPTQVALCYSNADGGAVLDPALVAGKIVVCDRGVTARVNKSLAVQQAGGVGMILLNTSPSSMNADFHYVPSVHLQNTDRAAVKAYAATPGAMATINAATLTFTDPAPFTASFSSRGPLTAGGGDLLKPDVIAPGQDILAAVSPAIAGREFDLLSGTSMSSPHVAGLAALLKDLHPDWSPMMIKSALMTSGYDVLDGPNTNPLVIFRQGAGHVRPNSAADPGLVYDSSFNNWVAFLCGATSGVNPAFCSSLAGAGYSLEPSNLNVPSIAIGDMAGVQTVNRTVTNVGGKEKYTFSYSGLAGITVTPSVNSFTIEKNRSRSYSVTFTTNGAPLNSYAGGYITWTGNKGHVVRIPVVIRPVAMAAPREVSGSYNVTFGYTGPFSATPSGLVPATAFSDSINTGDFLTYPVTVPAGTTYARFAIFDSETTPGSDLDLYIYNGAGTLVGVSAGGTSDETVNLVNPTAGNYTIAIDGFGTANPSTFTVYAWVLDGTDAGNMTVSAPASATVGTVGTINLTFSGLTPGVKYLGRISYSGVAGLPSPTVVRVDP
ncbi:MAG: S8 family serine peptidase [Chloroflexi bacterium]|nr:S8 family serine peptidase [Chloroflexota bacterium]